MYIAYQQRNGHKFANKSKQREMELKKIKLLVVMLFSIAVAACGGGSDSGSAAQSGTAAEYFTKNAVGNTWTTQGAYTNPVGTSTNVDTVADNTGGVVTVSSVYTRDGVTYPAWIFTVQIDSTGALISTDGSGNKITELPAIFSVGTSWSPDVNEVATIVAFDVTHTVPAGTFTDCLLINYVFTNPLDGSTSSSTVYYSPTAGHAIEWLADATGDGWKLQSYVANP